MSYLLDTNIISELVRLNVNTKVADWFDSIPNSAFHISVLTLGEIRKGIEKVSDNKRRQKLKIWLEHELPAWFEHRVLPIDKTVADRWGRLQIEAKRTLPAIDSLIAATALHHDLTLVTRNTKDFAGLSLELINPFQD